MVNRGANDKRIVSTGGKLGLCGILDVHNVERTRVTFTSDHFTNTPHIGTTSDHHQASRLETMPLLDLSGLKINHSGVTLLQVGVGVTDGSSVVGGDVRGSACSHTDLLHLANLHVDLIILDLVQHKTSLGIVQQSELITRLLDGDNIHEPSGVLWVRAGLSVNLHKALLQNHLRLSVVQCVLQTVPKDQDQRQASIDLVRPRTRLGGKNTTQLIHHPVRRCR
mmetsp:Transcript_6150/g.11437  ORF Transcript_6150/g.11437 Transcript_6150/m.11437 type:complete len:223 (+) Transcript_6150:337-1005(+)